MATGVADNGLLTYFLAFSVLENMEVYMGMNIWIYGLYYPV